MTVPQRIQRYRTKGWRMPEGAIYVGRPTIWGNPYAVQPAGPGQWEVPGIVGPLSRRTADRCAVEAYRRALISGDLDVTPGHAHDVLAGHDLVCWCPLDQPCHADVLLELANPEAEPFGILPGGAADATEDPESDRCPECRGIGGVLVDSMTLYSIPGGEDWVRCETCKGTGNLA